MTLPGRTHSSPAYRYGFQGQEKDDELKGEGNSLNYTFRMHDPRVGRFFAVDPLTHQYPWYSPYSFSGNRVIDMIELEGLETAEHGKNVDPYSQQVKVDNPVGGYEFIPSNAIPLVSENGNTEVIIAYNRVFNYVRNKDQVGFVDSNNKHLFYYQRDNEIKNKEGWFTYQIWKLSHESGGDILDFIADPVAYSNSVYNSVKNIDLGKTWKAIQNLGDEEAKAFGATLVYGLASRSPKSSLWSLGKFSKAVDNAYDHWKKHSKEFPELNNALEYIKKTKSFFKSPPKGALVKVQKNTIMIYDKKNNIFGMYDLDGTPRSLYKPNPRNANNPRGHKYSNNDDWWDNQPGIESTIK